MGKWWKGEPLTGVGDRRRAEEAANAAANAARAETSRINAEVMEAKRIAAESASGGSRARRKRSSLLLSSARLGAAEETLGATKP